MRENDNYYFWGRKKVWDEGSLVSFRFVVVVERDFNGEGVALVVGMLAAFGRAIQMLQVGVWLVFCG